MRKPLGQTKFLLGQIVILPGAREALSERGDVDWEAGRLLARHHIGDWGDTKDEDRRQNDENLERDKGELFSVYKEDGVELWVITEPHNKLTTILCPQDVENHHYVRRGH